MLERIKDRKEILNKLGIERLNPMQEEAHNAIKLNENTVVLSPTGTGKTLAFLLPILEELDPEIPGVQVLVLVPSRELAIQLDQVIREMGSGYKANAVYGGRAFSKDKTDLSHPPAILTGTPGRVADHLRRETFEVKNIKILVLDEFDKSLEVGFEVEMKEIIEALPNLQKRILTSATQGLKIPKFTGVSEPVFLDYLAEGNPKLQIEIIASSSGDKKDSLLKLVSYKDRQTGIIFCNFKDTINEVSDFLSRNRIDHGCFFGGMDQKERERALIKFRNGTYRLIIATDLAARGLDIPALDFIVHYQLPLKAEEFTHRNGRTARMQESGTAYVLQGKKEELPEFIPSDSPKLELNKPTDQKTAKNNSTETLFISGGRKDKISKGDIAGLFLKQGNLQKEELGVIELKQDCAFVAVPSEKAEKLIRELNDVRLKKKKVRVYKI